MNNELSLYRLPPKILDISTKSKIDILARYSDLKSIIPYVDSPLWQDLYTSSLKIRTSIDEIHPSRRNRQSIKYPINPLLGFNPKGLDFKIRPQCRAISEIFIGVEEYDQPLTTYEFNNKLREKEYNINLGSRGSLMGTLSRYRQRMYKYNIGALVYYIHSQAFVKIEGDWEGLKQALESV